MTAESYKSFSRNRLRHFAEVILGRSAFLESDERALVEQVLGRGVRPREVPLLKEVSTRTIQRRIQRVTERLMDEEVVVVLRQHRRWDARLGEVALDVWVRGRTMRETAERLGLSLHTVRERVRGVRELIRQGLRERRGGRSGRGSAAA